MSLKGVYLIYMRSLMGAIWAIEGKELPICEWGVIGDI